MWIINVIFIFAAIALISWVLWQYGQALANGISVLFSGGQSLLLALGFILLEALKAAMIAAIGGGVFGLIFFVAGAPESIIKSVAISVACSTFALLTLKGLWDNFNNLRWSIRNTIRNRYR